MKTHVGIELGSTRIKAVAIDENFCPVSSGDYTWASKLENGIWTYDIPEAIAGLKTALSGIECRESVSSVGISGMMHGYLAFDENWQLLVPFRTWQNTMTEEASSKLTELFDFHIPQRLSIAHLYQAYLNGEEHIARVAHITTIAGYMHYLLTGENAVGLCEASGIFPIDTETHEYNTDMLDKFSALVADMPWNIRDLLPKPLKAGSDAGKLTVSGASIIDDLLPVGTRFVPPEGDAGTGIVATNSVSPKSASISAGTSVFSCTVLEAPLKSVYSEIDVFLTPLGDQLMIVHGNNGTKDINAWASVLKETLELFGCNISTGEMFEKVFKKSLESDPDCSGITVLNYMAGETVTHFNKGCPVVIRRDDSKFTLANFIRAQIYTTFGTLSVGKDIIKAENIKIDRVTAHGGLFKTPLVAQKYLAALYNAPVTCMETAGEGGPYGMAILAAYIDHTDIPFDEYMSKYVFKDCKVTTVEPDPDDVTGIAKYMEGYKTGLAVERTAIDSFYR